MKCGCSAVRAMGTRAIAHEFTVGTQTHTHSQEHETNNTQTPTHLVSAESCDFWLSATVPLLDPTSWQEACPSFTHTHTRTNRHTLPCVIVRGWAGGRLDTAGYTVGSPQNNSDKETEMKNG